MRMLIQAPPSPAVVILSVYVLCARSVTRVEPKVLMANERTFINWLSMATKIGSFSAALAGAPACMQYTSDSLCVYSTC